MAERDVSRPAQVGSTWHRTRLAPNASRTHAHAVHVCLDGERPLIDGGPWRAVEEELFWERSRLNKQAWRPGCAGRGAEDANGRMRESKVNFARDSLIRPFASSALAAFGGHQASGTSSCLQGPQGSPSRNVCLRF